MIFRMTSNVRRTIMVSLFLLICLIGHTIEAQSHGGTGNIKEPSYASPPVGKRRRRAEEFKGQCDISSGEWIHDDSYPLYDSNRDCPYLTSQFNCRRNGRPDSDYQKWRWKPKDCSVPRFNASEMLENMRGKRLIFVGDSLSHNQWESMVCMLQAVIPENRKAVVGGNPVMVFQAQDYNTSVEFFWAPFLVQLDNRTVGNETKRILRLDSIENNGKYWRGIDILLFESAHWWTQPPTLKQWDYIEDGKNLYEDMDRMVAYKRGLTTWANWIDSNVDPRRTQVLFRSISPLHSSPRQWNNPGGHKCYNETEPITDVSYLQPFPPHMAVLRGVLNRMKFHVPVLNITELSDFRKDAHPSVYTDLTVQQRRDPDHFADCSHWCVWGLPDIWNELLYASLVFI